MNIKRRAKFKTCPSCGMRMIESTPTCEECGLVFERLNFATNKDAKRKIKRGYRDYIIRTRKLPSDVKYWKLLLLVIFTGLMGGHNYYVGRYLRGSIFSILFVITILCCVLNSWIMAYYPQWMELIGALVIGPFGLVWLYDVTLVIIKKFRVPIAIDLEKQDFDEVIKEK